MYKDTEVIQMSASASGATAATGAMILMSKNREVQEVPSECVPYVKREPSTLEAGFGIILAVSLLLIVIAITKIIENSEEKQCQ